MLAIVVSLLQGCVDDDVVAVDDAAVDDAGLDNGDDVVEADPCGVSTLRARDKITPPLSAVVAPGQRGARREHTGGTRPSKQRSWTGCHGGRERGVILSRALSPGPGGLTLTHSCGAVLELVPRVRIDGQWHGFDACVVERDNPLETRCSAAVGTILATVSEGRHVDTRFEAAPGRAEQQGGSLDAFEWSGSVSLPGATGFLSNGFQSWSQSGLVAIGDAPDPTVLEEDSDNKRTGSG